MTTLEKALYQKKEVSDFIKIKASFNSALENKEMQEIANKTKVNVWPTKIIQNKKYDLGSITDLSGNFIVAVIIQEGIEIFHCYDSQTWEGTLKNFGF